MAAKNSAFDTLFDNSVPHILEKIFFSLDYDSFMTCHEVSHTWNELLVSDRYQRESEAIFLEKKTNVEKLCHYSKNGNVKQVSKILSLGMYSSDRREASRMTPLHYAAIGGHKDVVQLLLDAGAKQDSTNEWDMEETALFLAMNKGHQEVAKLLIRAGADLNKFSGYYGDTPLCTAASYGLLDVTEALIAAGADLNKASLNYGETPLHLAALYGHKDAAKLLLDAGANPNRKNSRGETALDLARKNGRRHVVELLTEKRETTTTWWKIVQFFKTFLFCCCFIQQD